MSRCRNPNCYAHDKEPCREGRLDLAECSSWVDGISSHGSGISDLKAPVLTARIPWSGNTLGQADLNDLSPRARNILIGVLGAHDAGKTTLLLGSYLQLLQGREIGRASFSGSYTLSAWEALAAWTRFDDAARPVTFPPHTPIGNSRVPGLLHFALRDSNDELRDILLTDAPGEWFVTWSQKEDAANAAGARWVIENADAYSQTVSGCQGI